MILTNDEIVRIYIQMPAESKRLVGRILSDLYNALMRQKNVTIGSHNP